LPFWLHHIDIRRELSQILHIETQQKGAFPARLRLCAAKPVPQPLTGPAMPREIVNKLI
jgi:hypothetical protein